MMTTTSGPEPKGVQKHIWEWRRYPDEESLSAGACQQVLREIQAKRDSLVCLATGSSPMRTYEHLVSRGLEDPDSFAQLRWMKLDEWGGLSMDDPGTCENFLQQVLLKPLGIPPQRYFGWESQPIDPEVECNRVEHWLAANGPIDIQLLGMGENGHIGFNEPALELQSGPHIARLSTESLAHPMLGQSRNQVKYGLTLGMNDILGSRRIFLLVSGKRKSEPLLRLATEPVSTNFPASFLRDHPAVSVLCDAEAASEIPESFFNSTVQPSE